MPTLARITGYPIKSLDGQDVTEARLLHSGALEFDRRFALVDQDERFVNGKRTALVHAIRSQVSLPQLQLHAEHAGEVAAFDLTVQRAEAANWLGARLHASVRLLENTEAGFPDDTEAPGPTVISTATLEAVASWFPGLSVDEVRRRFRANLEIGDVEPFWEDHLYGAAGQAIPFRVGDVILHGVNPCQRCAVPTRSSFTGEVWPAFAKTIGKLREQHLPTQATRARFNHFYRLAVNTAPPTGFIGGVVRRGDEIALA